MEKDWKSLFIHNHPYLFCFVPCRLSRDPSHSNKSCSCPEDLQAKNVTSAIVGASAGGDKIKLDGQNHFGDLDIFDDPITLDNNLHSTSVGQAQGFYLFYKNDVFTARLGFSFVFHSSEHQGSIHFAGAGPLMNKTRDILVIRGTGEFFVTRGVVTIMTDAFEGEVYFRLRVDIKLHEC